MSEYSDPEYEAGEDDLYKNIKNPKAVCEGKDTNYLVDLMSKTVKGYPNQLMRSLELGVYSNSYNLLRFLRLKDKTNDAMNMLINHNRGNCFKILFAKQELRLGQQSTRALDEDEHFEATFNELLKLEPVVSKSVKEENLLAWMIKQQLDKYALTVIDSLSPSDMDIIWTINNQCQADCSTKAHQQNCTRGYNILMLALKKRKDSKLLKKLVEIACTNSETSFKHKLVVGVVDPQIFAETENSLRLAAQLKDSDILVKLLYQCVVTEKQVAALLEVDQNSGSAWKGLMEANALDNIENFLKEMEESILKELQQALHDSVRKHTILSAGMSVDAIHLLYQYIFVKSYYLIPEPTRSQPYALIVYDPSEKFMKQEAEAIHEALKKRLRWPNVELLDNWTVENILAEIEERVEKANKNGSIFLLCITSHGSAGKINDKDGKDVALQEILNKLIPLPSFIPKVSFPLLLNL